jgi:hypothetical protein
MATKRKRTPTKCECCGFNSWNGRVCKFCIKFYGPPAENAIAARELSRRLEGCHSLEDVMAVLGSLCDYIVDISDLNPPKPFPQLLYSTPRESGRPPRSAPPTASAK